MKVFLLLVGASLAVSGQALPNATWTGGGGNSNWSNAKNWSWDNNACQQNAPGTFTGTLPGDTCYAANVTIPGGFSVTLDVGLTSAVNNFTLSSGASLNGSVSALGNAMIAQGASVQGAITSSSATVTNQGDIVGGVGGQTVINSGNIKVTGSVFAAGSGTNTGIIEATAGGSFGGVTGAAGLSGEWNNNNGTIEIDKGAMLIADGTITSGRLSNSGGTLAGGPLTIAGIVTSDSATLDAPAATGPATVTVTGTWNISGVLTVGLTHGVSTVKVPAGGVLSVSQGGQTILGDGIGSTGQLEFLGASTLPSATGGSLLAGVDGIGYVSVQTGATLNAGNVRIGRFTNGMGQLVVEGGVVNYVTLTAEQASMTPGIFVYLGGNLVGASGQAKQEPGDFVAIDATVTGAGSRWTVNSGLTVDGGVLSVGSGGQMGVVCSSCSLDVLTVDSATINVTGTSAVLSAGLTTLESNGNLIVESGASVNIKQLNALDNSSVTVDGSNSKLTSVVNLASTSAAMIRNRGLISSSYLTLNGTATLTAQTGGTASVGFLLVRSGGILIENQGVLNGMGDQPYFEIGGQLKQAVLTLSDTGAMNSIHNIDVAQNGTLKVSNKDNITMFAPAKVSLSNGGTIDVSQGILNLGIFTDSPDLGWVNVQFGGTLTGGQVCPKTPAPEMPCVPHSLFNGRGTVVGSVGVGLGGTVSIDPELLSISQKYQQTGGTLQLEIDGSETGQYDQLAAGGSIQITGGTVEMDFANGFAPHSGDKYQLLSASGGFSMSNTPITTTGLASGFNYTTDSTGGQFNLIASNNGTSTTKPPTSPPITVTSLDSASGATALAPGSLASAYGTKLAAGQPVIAPFPWPTQVGGTSVSILDVTGYQVQAPVLYASPGLVNYMIPENLALGPATVVVTSGDGTKSIGSITLGDVAPGLFEVNSAGLSASFAACIASNGNQTTVLTSQVVSGAVVALPLNLKACKETVLELWTTGLDLVDPTTVHVTIGGTEATLLYAGPQGEFPGVDQVNVVIPQSLAGAGSVPIELSTRGLTSNTVHVTLQ
ncbi:MAG TPA: hypothetical protein VFW44_01310 [Bryobacteraceae bacterium]|nr:hypothetical protein [Bryobacteraceae bacterium]